MRVLIGLMFVIAGFSALGVDSSSGLQIETAEKEELARQIEAFEKLSPARQRELRKQSEAAISEAEAAFDDKEYEKALTLFGRALDLYPKSQKAQYRQAVAAYKNGDMKWAVIYLNLSDSEEVNAAEKSFFLGMSYYKLKDYEKAIAHFASVKESGDKDLAPSAAFYNGFYQFQQKNYALAKSEFQYVLDTSNDPDMDEKAEQYIEVILKLLQQENFKAKKVFLSGMVGVQYDSNILFSPESAADQGSATDEGGARLLTLGQARWRPYYSEHHEFSLTANLLYLLSFEEDFRRADPFLLGVEAPYSYKGKVFGKSYRLDIAPGFETLYMDADNNDERENILNSPKIAISNTFIMNPQWFSSYRLAMRYDDSELEVDDPADDSTAVRTELSTTQTKVFNPATEQLVSLTGKFTLNQADGDNATYRRCDLGALYSQKLPWWGLSSAVSAGYYHLKYPDHSDNRVDKNLALNLTLSKPVAEWLTVILTGGYIDNDSTVTNNDYSKFTTMLGASLKHSF